ncbi:MAG: HAMP domain-containing sensor histidine kinase [Nocardioidaceae bacterium]
MTVPLGPVWRRFLPRARITTRIVAAVSVAMAVVLVAAGAFVYWRISFALDRQLDQDLRAYTDIVVRDVRAGESLPADNPGEAAQTYDASGSLLAKSDAGVRTLLDSTTVRSATTTARVVDLERFLPPPGRTPYRVSIQTVDAPSGTVVLATAISRAKHDEALRELLLQLSLADLATVLAAGLVGWGATRAALGPVEAYRRAAARAEGDPRSRLPVDADRDDELTRLGTTFNTLLAEIEAGQERERQFLADASHELRSPLALLSAEVEWARHRPRSAEDLERVLASVADQTQRLASLADALLDLEEVNEGSLVRRHPVALDALVGAAVDGFRAQAAAAGRRLVVEADPDPVPVEPHWVEVAVGNLVGNALKHGRGQVSVAAHVTGGTITVEVVDEGGGIPAELGDEAFERFARADRSRTTPGHGLGLALVQAVARRHGGVTSLIPGGVRIELPAGGLAGSGS